MQKDEFEAFFTEMRPRLLRAATRYLDVDSANDAAISALHTIWVKQVPSPTDEKSSLQLKALAFRILDGHVKNIVRTQRRQARLAAAVAQQEATRRPTTDISDWIDQDNAALRVRQVTDELPPHEREVVLLIIDGFKTGEIATILGISAGAVSMRLARAKRRLAETVAPQGVEA